MRENTNEEAKKTEEEKGDTKEKVKNEGAAASVPMLDLDIQTPYIDAAVAKHKKAKKIRKRILTVLAALFVLMYFGGVLYHSLYFPGMTTLNDLDVSGKNITYVTDIVNKDMSLYELKVDCVNEEHNITSADKVFKVSTEKSITDVLRDQNPWLWFVNIWNSHSIDLGYTAYVDETALYDLILSYECMQEENMEEPKDAYVSIDGGEAHIVEETKGSVIDTAKAESVIKTAIEDMAESVDLYENECYEKADVCSDSTEFEDKLKDAEDYLSIEAVYDFNGYEVPVTKEQLADMAYFDKNGNLTVSESKVKKFVESFAEEYSTCYTDRKFKNHHGDTILVYGGYYGWQLDAETETPLLYESLTERESFTREFSCTKEGYAYSDMNDIGSNYVEIDLTHQHVYVYENNKQVFDSACVSGNLSLGMSTPGGLYPLTYKELNATLNGATYSTPVSYWMPFNGDIGMHDATWKTEFGEEYYKTDGSHGCINLPLEAAATIFDYVEKGSPVVCYWEDEVEYVD